MILITYLINFYFYFIVILKIILYFWFLIKLYFISLNLHNSLIY